MLKKRRKPSFRRQRGPFTKRIKNVWRRPRGQNSKQRKKYWEKGAHPGSGWGNPKDVRGLHPSGYPEVLVNNPSDLEGLKDVVVRIASSVGKRKRAEIVKKAEELGLKVINA